MEPIQETPEEIKLQRDALRLWVVKLEDAVGKLIQAAYIPGRDIRAQAAAVGDILAKAHRT